MKKVTKKRRKPEMLEEYDFRGGECGKYAARYAQGTNIIVLSPDVAEFFPDSASANKALRAFIKTLRRIKPASSLMLRTCMARVSEMPLRGCP